MKRCKMIVAFLFVAGALACDPGRREAEAVGTAVARFRSADNASMPAMLDTLKSTPCSAADVCKTRDACVESGSSTVKGLLLKSEVEKSIRALEKGALAKDSIDAQVLPSKLDEAERLLKQGFDGLSKCDDEMHALKRKYRF